MGLFSAESSIMSSLTLLLYFILGDCNFFQSFYKIKECNVSTVSFFYFLGKWPSRSIATRSVILWFHSWSWHCIAANPNKKKSENKVLNGWLQIYLSWLGQTCFTELPRAQELQFMLSFTKKEIKSKSNKMMKPQLLLLYWPVRKRLIC